MVTFVWSEVGKRFKTLNELLKEAGEVRARGLGEVCK